MGLHYDFCSKIKSVGYYNVALYYYIIYDNKH